MSKFRILAAALMVILLHATWSAGQGLDETWTVTVNGQTVQVNPDGSFRIPNIAAPDQFGSGGPGTSPDFLSDDFLRVVGTSTAGGKTRYAFSESFQIRRGQVYRVGDLIITDEPPPFPNSIDIDSTEDLIEVGDSLQLAVTGIIEDGSTVDVTARSTLTIYRTSNPKVATVGPNGLVSAHSAGPVFITAVNEGATAVRRLTVTSAVVATTIEGFVQLEDGSPVANATVSTLFSPDASTDSSGFFSFVADVPAEAIVVRASAEVEGERLNGSTGLLEVISGGLTDAGIIVINEGSTRGMVVRRSSNTAHVIDAESEEVEAVLTFATDVIDVAIAPGGGQAAVASFSGQRLYTVDLTMDPPQITGFVNVPLLAEDVEVFCTDTGIALIATNNSPRIVSVNMASLTVVSNLSLPVGAAGIDVTPDATTALVNTYSGGTGSVRVISVSPTGVLTDTGVSVTAGGNALNLSISPDGSLALVANWSSGSVGVLSIGDTIEFVTTVNVGVSAQSIAFTPDGTKAYVQPANSGDICVLTIDADGQVTDTGIRISNPLGQPPSYFGVDQMAVTSNGQFALAASSGGVLIIDAATDEAIGQITLPSDGGVGGIDVFP